MKKITLLSLMLFVVGFCKAQDNSKIFDSCMKVLKDSGLATMGSGTTSGVSALLSTFPVSGTPNEYKKDTIPALILVSDTSVWSGFTTAVYFFNPIARAEQKHHSINWIRGYIVRNITIEKQGGHYRDDLMWYNNKDEYYYSVAGYLDDEMKPFSKDFIVWQTK